MKKKRNNILTIISIPVSLLVGYIIYEYVIGMSFPSYGGDSEWKIDDLMNFIYQAGYIVIFFIAIEFLVLAHFVERLISFSVAEGKSNKKRFYRNIENTLQNDQIDESIRLSSAQGGSLGKVLNVGLANYKSSLKNTDLSSEQQFAVVRNKMDEHFDKEDMRLNRNVYMFNRLASFSILLALFGILVEIIQGFTIHIRTSMSGSTGLSEGIAQAVAIIALGAITLISAYLAYKFCEAKVEKIEKNIQKGMLLVLQIIRFKHDLILSRDNVHGNRKNVPQTQRPRIKVPMHSRL